MRLIICQRLQYRHPKYSRCTRPHRHPHNAPPACFPRSGQSTSDRWMTFLRTSRSIWPWPTRRQGCASIFSRWHARHGAHTPNWPSHWRRDFHPGVIAVGYSMMEGNGPHLSPIQWLRTLRTRWKTKPHQTNLEHLPMSYSRTPEHKALLAEQCRKPLYWLLNFD